MEIKKGVGGYLVMFIVFCVIIFLVYLYCPGEKSKCSELVSKELIVGLGEKYASIQQAIDAASPRDIIIVNSGEYNENIEINKKLTLKANNTVIINPADKNLPGFSVTADDVTISGFTVSGFSNSYGMIFKDVKNCIVSDNFVDSNMWGIVIYSSANCEITNNEVTNHMDFWGKEGEKSPSNLLGEPSSGIQLIKSEYILIKDNKLQDNVNGIDMVDSHNNIILNNRAKLTERRYESTRYNNGISSFGFNNTIKNNVIEKYADAINLVGGSDNKILTNTIFDSAVAINLDHRSTYSIIRGNTAKNNDHGIVLWDKCSKNIIENNHLIDNNIGLAFYYSSDYNIVKNTVITESREVDIDSKDSNNNQIIDSLFKTHQERNSTLEII